MAGHYSMNISLVAEPVDMAQKREILLAINRPPKRCTVVAGDLGHRAGLEQALDGERLLAVTPNQDAIAVISAALREVPSDELHLVAHGAPGQIQLGQGIDRAGLLARAHEIGGWGVERIVLWSCRVGADQAFISLLEELSGASVVTSAEALGLGNSLTGAGFPELEEAVAALPGELTAGESFSGSLSAALDYAGANGSANSNFNGSNPFILSDTTVAAGSLNALNALTSGDINAATVSSISGAATDVKALYASTGFSGLGNEAVTLSGSVSVADASSIDGSTSGVITATITETAISTLGELTGTGNAYYVSVTDTSVNAADLNTLDNKTTVNVNATSAGTLTGTAAAINTAINASTIDTGAAVIANINSGTATVAQANSIDVQTTGVITATISDTAISTLGNLTGTGNAYSITVSDSYVNAAALNTLDGKTTVNVNAASVGTLTGSAADIAAAICATTIDTASGVDVVIASSATQNQYDLIDQNTTGSITYGDSNIPPEPNPVPPSPLQSDGFNGSIADALAFVGANGSAADSGFNGSNAITLTDATANAADLNTLDGKTNVNVNAASVGTLIGTAADIATAISAATIDTAAAVVATVTGSATVAQANTIDANTTGVVTATISDTAISTLGGLTGTGNSYSITVADSSVTAAALNTLDSKTTVAVNANTINAISGTGADVTTAFNSAGISNLSVGNDSVTISDTNLGGSDPTALDTGAGTDTLSSTSTASQTLVVAGANAGTLGSINYSNLENISLGFGADTATIAANTGTLNMGAGNDSITLNTGAAGTINADAGDDSATIAGTAAGSLNMGAGIDTVSLTSKTSTTTIDAGDDADILNSQTGSINSTLNITGTNAGTLDAASFSNFETINMGDGNDYITLNTEATGLIFAGDGNDSATVNANADGTLVMGDGSDTVTLTSLNSTAYIDGGFRIDSDIDTLNSQTGAVNSNLNIRGPKSGELDEAYFHSFEVINLDDGEDTATISASAGTVNLGGGNDSITLNAGTTGNINADSGNDSATINSFAAGNLNMGNGSDTVSLTSHHATTVIDGGSGDTDTLNTQIGAVVSFLNITAKNTGSIGQTTFSNFETITMGDGADGASIAADAGTVNMGDGNDVISIYTGAAGTINADEGNDLAAILLTSSPAIGSVVLDGGGGNDDLRIFFSDQEFAKLANTDTLSQLVRYLSSPTGKTLEVTFNEFSLSATGFETAGSNQIRTIQADDQANVVEITGSGTGTADGSPFTNTVSIDLKG